MENKPVDSLKIKQRIFNVSACFYLLIKRENAPRATIFQHRAIKMELFSNKTV